MYTLEQIFDCFSPEFKHELWQGKIICGPSNKEYIFRINQMQSTAGIFAFTLVKKGQLIIDYDGRIIELNPYDLYRYMPGFALKVVSASDDYEGLMLLTDEQAAYRTLAYRNDQSFYSLLGAPKISLTPEQAFTLNGLMLRIREIILHPNPLSDDLIGTYYQAFVMELSLINNNPTRRKNISKRQEDIFVQFYSLMRQHFLEHRDLAFYADKLHITTTYLSRVALQLTHHTATHFIEQTLLNESVWLLRSSELSISQIADRLNFSSPAAFCKFFTRLTGRTPKNYRNR